MTKKITLEDIGVLLVKHGKGINDLTESVAFVIKKMATKEDVREIVKEVIEPQFKKIDERLTAVESKITGTNRRLDTEAMQRTDFKIPKRVHDLEMKVFKVSKHPKDLVF